MVRTSMLTSLTLTLNLKGFVTIALEYKKALRIHVAAF